MRSLLALAVLLSMGASFAPVAARAQIEGGQRISLPTRTVQRQHQLRVEALPVRGSGDQRLKLRHQLTVLSQRQPRTGKPLGHIQPLVF